MFASEAVFWNAEYKGVSMNKLIVYACAISILLLGSIPTFGASGTWTTTGAGSTGYWTNNANWSGASYPGFSGTNDAATLTNNTVGTTFTVVLDTNLPGMVSTLNLGAKLTGVSGNGMARLFITNNAAITNNGTIYLGNGWLELDGTTVTNNAGLGQSITWSGTNSTLLLNNNAALYTLGEYCSGSYTALVSCATAQGGTWNMAGGVFQPFGQGNAGASNSSLTITGPLSLTNMGTCRIGYGYTSYHATGDNLVVSNGAQLFSGSTFYLGYTAGDNNNNFQLGGAGAPSAFIVTGQNSYIGGSSGAFSNTMTVSNAYLAAYTLKFYGTNETLNILYGGIYNGMGGNGFYNYGFNNNVVVNRGSVASNFGSIIMAIGQDGSSYSNSIYVINGGMITNVGSASMLVGDASGSYGNSLVVSNGGQIFCGGPLDIGNVAGTYNNLCNIGGAGALSIVTNGAITIGLSTSPYNTMNVTNANISCQALTVGNDASSNTLNVYAGGSINLNNQSLIVGSGNIGLTYSNTLTVNGGVLTNINILDVGYKTNILCSLLITNGGAVYESGSANIGVSTGSYNNVAMVTGNRSIWKIINNTLTVGFADATCSNNAVSILNGGLAELSALTLVGSSSLGNLVTNSGGIYQFTNATPTITLTGSSYSNFLINSGTVAFRGITNADVLCNQSAKPLDSTNKMLWVTGGSNTFRMNNSTNYTPQMPAYNQAYTFTTANGATNFARLELLNNSMYRSNVTLGVNGSLYVSGGPSTISGVLTAAPSATIEIDLSNTNAYSLLVLTTNVYLGGCSLKLDLANPPILNTPIMIISNSSAVAISGSFAYLTALTINGTNYMTSINLVGGNGNDVVITTKLQASGTTLFFW